ncbi:MAG TPA: RES domain-containing protein [Gammaproteobacteria bacterium]|nr:RES domain-containing protein [Gammaproteobacteria bacterium]
MILYRCFAWNGRARRSEPDGPLWFPRIFQGEGRHDNPDIFGCLYVADRAVSSIVEQLARFRSQALSASLLRRRGLPLALAELELTDAAEIVDLDDPIVLQREGLRPSLVATRHRDVTQPQARTLHERRSEAAGLRWWSVYEALWMNVTLFERAARLVRVRSVQPLAIDHPAVLDAADFFGMRVR